MLIRNISDLHIDHHYDTFDSKNSHASKLVLSLVPELPLDSETVLIIAGDLGGAYKVSRIKVFLELVIPRFKHVIYVLGNHEYYGMEFGNAEIVIDDMVKTMTYEYQAKLSVVNSAPQKITIEDVTFFCGTMWTSYNDNDKKVITTVTRHINDHKLIKDKSGAGLAPTELSKVFHKTVEQFKIWFKENESDKIVVVTHHLPSFSAVDPQYMNDDVSRLINHAFASDLDSFIKEYKPQYWFFGHTHTGYNGLIGSTALRCNPFGYPNERNFVSGKFDIKSLHVC